MNRPLAVVSAALGFLGVVFGAMGAHGVKRAVEHLPDAAQRLSWWETGARYHLPHALAVALVAVLAAHTPSTLPRAAAWLFTAGVVLFSGSLYLLALTGERQLGLITPFGGIALAVGWAVFGLAALRLPKA